MGKILRITRSCGYIRNPIEERDQSCFKASFTASSSSRYCSCEGNKCNSSMIKLPSSLLLIMTTIAYAVLTIINV